MSKVKEKRSTRQFNIRLSAVEHEFLEAEAKRRSDVVGVTVGKAQIVHLAIKELMKKVEW